LHQKISACDFYQIQQQDCQNKGSKMADDGMLINFDLGDGALVTRPIFRGGSWKDRLTAKKSAEYNRAKRARKSDDPQNENVQSGSGEGNDRPAKKIRLEQPVAGVSYAQTNRARPNTSAKRTHNDSSGKPQQVVSSLFTYNPASKTTADTPDETNETVEPSNAPLKSELDTFTSLGLSAQLAEHLLSKLNVKAPTAIQRASVSQLIKEDSDAFIQAQTGSGKTLAYLLPIVQRIMSLSAENPDSISKNGAVHRDSGLFAIIIAPTRELSKQIQVVLESLLRCAHWIVSGIVIGGEKKKSEKARLRKGLNILIATPGRLVDHLEHTKTLDVSNVRWVVLDEGDRLMELGFEKDIEKILSKLSASAAQYSPIKGLPTRRTTVLCSATMKMDVQKLGEISLKDAVHIQADASVGEEEVRTAQAFSAPAQLQQSFAVVPAKLRLVTLAAFLKRTFSRHGSVMKAIIFVSCADVVDFLFELFVHEYDTSTDAADSKLATPSSTTTPTPSTTSTAPGPASNTRTDAPALSISSPSTPVHLFRLHGSLAQSMRTSTLSAFTCTKTPSILLATDVASRGLDLPNIDLVIEYDPPFAKEDHLHRIGRTARAGRDGRAMIFLQPGNEEGYVGILKDTRADGGRGVTRHGAEDLLRRGFGSTGLGGGKDWEARATEWQLAVERWVLSDEMMLEMARKAYQSHIRSYATHVAAERHIFDMTTLHLGHLAKAYGLRDKPGSIRVPGLRPGKMSREDVRRERKAGAKNLAAKGEKEAGGAVAAGQDVPGAVDVNEAMRMMRRKARMQQAGASEFNIG